MTSITQIKKGDLMTMPQVAEKYGIKESTLRHWRRKSMDPLFKGKYPDFTKIGGTVFLLEADLLDYVNRQRAA